MSDDLFGDMLPPPPPKKPRFDPDAELTPTGRPRRRRVAASAIEPKPEAPMPPARRPGGVLSSRDVPREDRPGTRLGKRTLRLMMKRGDGPPVYVGTYDKDLRIYQRGTRVKAYLYSGCMSFGLKDEWHVIQEWGATHIEHIDLETGLDTGNWDDFGVYCISVRDAKRLGRKEETRLGWRWLVPIEAFDIVDRHGNLVKKGDL